MKRRIALILALMLLFTLAACGGKSDPPAQSGNSSSGDGNSSSPGLTQKEIEEAEQAMETLEAWARAQGWDENPYGNWIYAVWDSEVLPACVPKEIEGVQVDQTTYKEKRHDTYTESYGIGNLNYADKSYEQWGVSFYCTTGQLDEFVAAMEANGFYGGQTSESEYRPTWEWLGNGYYAYLSVNPQITGEGDYTCLAWFDITQDDNNPYPVAFMGTKLPQMGAVVYNYKVDGAGYAWVGEDYDMVEGFWDVFADKGELPEDWGMWLDYFGVNIEDAKACAQNMAAQGWTITHESTWYDGEGYVCYLEKGEIVGGVAQGADGPFTFSVGFGSIEENLWY